MRCSDITTAVMPAAAISSTGMMSFQLRPAKKITYRPPDRISSEVPRSGCFITRPTGTASSRPAMTKSSPRNCPSRRWNHQASISGIAILRISEGCTSMPTLSQRVAPFLVMPNRATATSSSTPMV